MVRAECDGLIRRERVHAGKMRHAHERNRVGSRLFDPEVLLRERLGATRLSETVLRLGELKEVVQVGGRQSAGCK